MNNTNIKTKRRLRKVFSCMAVFTLLFTLNGCSKKTPREALEEAYDKTFVTGSPVETLLGLTDINKKITENSAHSTGFSLTLQELSGSELEQYSGFLSGLGITVDTASDLLNRKSGGTLDITYGGTTYLTLGGQLQGSKIHITSPQLLHGSLMVNLSTLKEDLASDSLLAQSFRDAEVELPEDYFSDLLNSVFEPSALTNAEELTSALKDFDEAILVEKLNKKEVSLPSGTPAKTVYSVTIPEDAYTDVINAAFEMTLDYYASLLESMGEYDTSELDEDINEIKTSVKEFAKSAGDIVLTVAVTKDGYISYVESKLKTDADSFSLTAAFTGENHPLEKTDIELKISDEDETVKFTYEEVFEPASSELTFSANMAVNQETVLSFAGEGEFEDVEKGKKYTLDFDYLEIELEDELSVSLAGDYYVDTTKCDMPALTGTEYNLFTLNQEEFTNLFTEILINIQNDPLLSELLGNLNPGM